MQYNTKSIPMTNLIATNRGFLTSLCDDCETLDCENDIEIRKVSILGINVEVRLLAKRDDAHMVITCDGYINNDAKTRPNTK